MKLKIGVDARHLSSKNNGLKTYLSNLLHSSIKKTLLTHEWFLFSPYDFDNNFSNFDNVKVIKMPLSIKFIGFHLFFSQVFIPYLVLIKKIDLIWFPANRSSLLLPKSVAQVLSIHDLVWCKYPETMTSFGLLLDKFFMTKSAKSADIVITISNSSLKDILKNKLANRKNTAVISNGVKKLIFDNKKIMKFDYFLFVGTIEPRKNLERVLNAYSIILPQIKHDIKFIIVGSNGWGNVNIENILEKYNLKKHVYIMNNVDDLSLAKLYASAKFLVMPSLYEGFGLPLIEAMTYGTPVLTANNSSMPEVCGNAGLLVDAFDVNSIANGLEEMINNNKLRKDLASKAKFNASRYNWNKSGKQLIKVFDNAIKLRKRRK